MEEELKFIKGAKAAEKEAASQRKYEICRELAGAHFAIWQDLRGGCALVTLRH